VLVPTAQLRWTLWIATLLAAWSGSPPLSADDAPDTGSPPPGTFNAAPRLIPAPDRSAIEEEVAAVMAMTPPDRRVMAELPSGSRLWIRPGGYERGPSGSDCRRFEYEYAAVGGATAVVAGSRCLFPAAAAWLPLSHDIAVEANGLVTPAAPALPEMSADPPARPAVREAAPPAAAATAASPSPSPPIVQAPPSRVILPFTPSR
jgi:hypothetical protein